MKEKTRLRFHGRSHRSANSKRQLQRKEAQKRAKYAVRPTTVYSNNALLRQNRQRGA